MLPGKASHLQHVQTLVLHPFLESLSAFLVFRIPISIDGNGVGQGIQTR
jgi:hypothetical protein